MQRKRLVATVAIVPLLVFAHGALAETTITTALTEPVTTADPPGAAVNDDVRVTSTGSIKPTGTAGGPVLLMNSSNDITNEGTIQWTGANNAVGMQAAGGLTGDIVNKGAIRIDEDYTPVDTDPDGDGSQTGDGDFDGPFAQGTGRYGIRVTAGTGLLTGSITNDTGASILVEGNASYGIRLEADMTGTLMHRGSISVTGDDGYGIRTQGEIDGALEVRGSVSVFGEDSVAVSVEEQVDGLFRIQGGVAARGYRSTAVPTTQEAFAALDADDLLLGGAAVQVRASVGGGILVDSARPADTDADETTPDNDEDDDGILDAEEGAGGAISSFGTAPALQIGVAGTDITVGAVGAGDSAFGLVNKGSITAAGVFPDFTVSPGVFRDHPSVALVIGSGSASTATLVGGVRNEGSVTATAVDANATAIRVTTGGQLGVGGVGGVLVNTGSIGAQTTAVDGPTSALPLPNVEEANTARAISIEAGGAVSALNNSGTITAIAIGENGDAIAIQDASGALRTITNTGTIMTRVVATDNASGLGTDTDDDDFDPSNETITGERIAIDLSAATGAITIVQNGVDDGDDGDDEVDDPDADEDGVDDDDEPSITGDILLGSGADSLTLNNGFLVGDMDFGDGANTLAINGGSIVQGRILNTGAGAGVSVDINDGRLLVTETDLIQGASLNVGADGILIVTIDADADTSTRFDVTTANFATGSQVGIISEGLLTFDNLGEPDETRHDFVIVDADTLTTGTIDQSLLGVSPYIYDVSVSVDEPNDNLIVRVGRRKAADIGFNAAQAAAYDAIYLAIGEDEDLRDAILGRFDRAGFLELYDQLMPDQGEGLFAALDMAQISIARAIATKPDLRDRYGPDSLWFQELNLQVKREAGDTLGSEAKAFGFVAGYEAMSDKGGALGATLAYITAEENDDAAKVGEQTTVSQFEGGLYWRQARGAWLFSVRGGAGYAWVDSTRRFLDPNTALIQEATADWTGYTLSAHGGVQYEQRFGRYYARPGVFVDYFYFSEGERQETGGAGLNQMVEARTSSRLSGTVELALGAEYGRDFWWRPEVRLGYRQVLAGEIGETVASFPGGSPFTLVASEPGSGAAIVAVALKMGTPMSYLAVEGEVEIADGEQRYNAKLTGRMMF